jgi:hypothetical protein
MPSRVYFGPNVKSAGLQHKSVHTGEFSPAVQALIKKNPGFASLFVSLEDFPRVNHELKDPGSVSAQVYKHFQNTK